MTLINQNSIIGVTSITSTASSDVITFHTSDTTERLRIDTSGNATFGGNVSVAGVLTYEDVTSVDAVGLSTFQNGIHVTGGNLLVGTTSAGGWLTKIQVADNASYQSAFNITNNVNADLQFEIKSNESRFGPSTNTPLVFKNGGGERLRITSGGNVGIGTDNPESGSKLTVNGGIFVKNYLTAATIHGGGIDYINDGRGTRITSFGASGAKTAISFAQGNGGSGASEIARFDTNGNLVFASSGQGIDFSAASGSAAGSTSALLDDYEEGTWTPTTTQFAEYTSNGRYTKIGRIVYIEGVITRNTTTTPNAVNLQAQSLPFTVNNISSVVSGNYWLDEGGPSQNQGDSVGSIYFTSTTVFFIRPTDPSNQSSARYVQADEVTNGRGVSFYGWYRV